MDDKRGALALIKEFFGLTMEEAKEVNKSMDETSKNQLASAIAREKGIGPEGLKFSLVEY